jgi:tetratricopeptide (TPR) repeat protein
MADGCHLARLSVPSHTRSEKEGEVKIVLPLLLTIALGEGTLSAQGVAPSTCDGQLKAGKAALDRGSHTEAEGFLAAALKTCVGPAAHASALANLGLAKMADGRTAEGAGLLVRSVVVLESDPATHDSDLALVWHALGTAWYYQKLYSRAAKAFGNAIRLFEKHPDGNPLPLFDSLSCLASVYIAQGSYVEAQAAIDRARSILDSARPPELLPRLKLLDKLGAAYDHQGRYDEALAVYLEISQQLDPATDPFGTFPAGIWNNLAREYMRRGDYAAGADALERAVSLLERGTPFSRSDVDLILTNYRICLRKMGTREQLRRFDARARAIMNAVPRQADGLLVDVTAFRSVK